MDEDAEYCAFAKNIAGEARSSAQLIVEPKDKPESVPKQKTTKPEPTKETKERDVDQLPDLSYLRMGRSRTSTNSSSSSAVKPMSSSSSSSVTKSASTSESDLSFDRKDENNLTNLGQKLAMTKDSVTDVAEDMLTSSKEVSKTMIVKLRNVFCLRLTRN